MKDEASINVLQEFLKLIRLTFALNKFDGLTSGLDNLFDVFAVRELAQIRRGTEHKIDSVDTSLCREPSIIHVTPSVSKNLALETKLADRLQITLALKTS
jgi:hypothetical protein